MKFFSILEPATRESIEAFAKKRGIFHLLADLHHHPQEDFLVVSAKPPVFVVADGVTLNFMKLIGRGHVYPNPSPAGDVAEIFCKKIIKFSRNKYKTFARNDLIAAFKYANGEVREYNRKLGKSDSAGNRTGYYAATAAFVIVKENKAYWASICDSFIAHFDAKMRLQSMSSGSCDPYAVINGESRMVNYIQTGILRLKSGDRLFVFTDGFEPYIKNVEFQKLFNVWDKETSSLSGKSRCVHNFQNFLPILYNLY